MDKNLCKFTQVFFSGDKIELSINGAIQGFGNFAIAENSKTNCTVPFTVAKKGIQHCKLYLTEYPDPDMLFDDEYFFSYTIENKVSVLQLVEKENVRDTLGYLANLFNTNNLYQFTSKSLSKLDFSTLNQYDLIITKGLTDISTGLSSELINYTKQGGSLMVFPSSTIDLDAYNNLLAILINLGKYDKAENFMLKAITIDPKFTEAYKVGDPAEGSVKNITDYALFISIKNSELDGMIHYKDISWAENDSDLKNYKKNQMIKFKILEIDKEKEKIRLGIRQLEKDPFEFFMDKNLSDVVTAKVDSTSKNGINVHVGDKNMVVLIKKNQLAKEVENQRTSRFAKGDKVDAMIIELDKTKRKVLLSIKALENKQSKEAVKKYGSTDSGGVLGEILGPLLKKKKPKSKK